MDHDTLRDGLKETGLSQYEADAYLALLERGSAPAVKIAEDTDVPKSRIYDVLRDLESESYIETYEQDSLHAKARDPSDVLDGLERRAKRLVETAEEIESRWEQPNIDDHKITIVKRFDSVLDRFRELAADAEYQIQLAATPSQLEALRPALADAIDRGIFVKLSVMTSPSTIHEVETLPLEEIATEARHRHLPAPFTALIDRTHTCFSPEARPTDQYGVLVRDVTMTYVFNWYFQSALWETWELLYADREEGNKRTYVDIRECICDIGPVINDGAEIPVTVDGFDTRTGDEVTLSGRIVEIISTGSLDGAESLSLAQLAGQATLVVESDGVEYGIGGRGATLEDLEMTRIVIEQPTTSDAGSEEQR